MPDPSFKMAREGGRNNPWRLARLSAYRER